MDTDEIARVLGSDPFTRNIVCKIFDGVHAADQLHNSLDRPMAMVVNTDPSWKPGRHWVAIYAPKRNEPWEYFDSYGEPPNETLIKTFLKKKNYIINKKSLQSPSSSVCGHYCIYYLVHRARGYTMDMITNRFTKDETRNDEDVYAFVQDNFASLMD